MERLVVKSNAGSLYYNDTEHGVKLEPHEIGAHQRRLLLERLHAYEDTGLTPAEVQVLKERDTAMEVNEIHVDEYYCPTCGEGIYVSDNFESHKFCLNCGQAIQWDENLEVIDDGIRK